MKNLNENLDRRIFKKTPEQLEGYMMFKRRGTRIESKKGKGSFKRKPKYSSRYEE